MQSFWADTRKANTWLRKIRQDFGSQSATTPTPSVTTKGYDYQPLSTESRQLRVLRFEKKRTLPFRRLRFKVETLLLDADQREPYYAISYAWGDNPGLASIVLDGQEALVPDSAEEALRGILRVISRDDGHQATLIWIDAVCINQDDLEEKSHQVAMMGRVYAKAQMVFSWLGPDDGTMSAAIRSFEAFQQQCSQLTDDRHDLDYLYSLPQYECWNLPCMRIPPPATCDLSACVSFFRCKYFTRLWIVQEMVVAKRVLITKGRHTMPLQMFEEAIFWAFLHGPSWFFSSSQGSDKSAPLWSLCWLRRKLQNGEELGLTTQLFLAPMYQTSNAWDKVYALLGMTNCEARPREESTDGKILPNYEKDLLVVYREATCKAIVSGNSLQVLYLAGASVPYLQNDRNWPSWVPRWHNMTADHLYGLPGPDDLCVDAYQQAVVDIGDEASKELHVQGVCVGEVINRLDIEGTSNTTLLEWLVSIWLKDPEMAPLKNAAAALVDGEYQGLHVDDAPDLLTDFLAFIIESKDQCSSSTRPLLDQIASELELRGGGGGDSEAFRRGCRFTGRASFHLQEGKFGVTNAKLACGDHVCILFGARRAFVLRKDGSNWKIRGLAYVPGIHKGEYIEQLRAEGRLEEETQTFTLT
ncbi:Heterokaryon incompatibility protein 6, OR allele [Pseudocercospora fuligena]|uniref:Heterokaryon incompatibility protein 6, OR allele n=1 Tax=Pseudocercospora fuligena TaxID=685502 RepID=A0A8H6VHR9_9PEZI|nr:Heterokaryon incompatibility protein 6, OR allele [Pseudocercospora fuligena]